MIGNLSGWHLLIVVVVLLLLFGAAKLPALAKSMGQSARIFKSEVRTLKDEDAQARSIADESAGSGSVSQAAANPHAS